MTHRFQGYRFGITGRGITSCRDNLSPEHFALLRDTCGKTMPGIARFEALTGAQLPAPGFFVGGRKDAEVFKADRTLMRQVLFKGLEQYTTFGKAVVGYEELGSDNANVPSPDEPSTLNGHGRDSGVLVRFADGSTERGSLLVGADSAFSRVRAQLTPQVKILDAQTQMVCGKTFLTPAFYSALGFSGSEDPRAEELFKSVAFVVDSAPQDSPIFFMFDPMYFGTRDAAIAADPELAADIPGNYIYWALALRSDRTELKGVDWRAMDAGAAADFAGELTKDWTPSLRALVAHADRTQTLPLSAAVMPVPLVDWRAAASAAAKNGNADGSDIPNQKPSLATNPMVTLIGDAAHAMPPTGGVGANLALTDAAILGAALAEHGVSRRALQTYETEMREYATEAIKNSIANGKMFFNMVSMEEMRPVVH